MRPANFARMIMFATGLAMSGSILSLPVAAHQEHDEEEQATPPASQSGEGQSMMGNMKSMPGMSNMKMPEMDSAKGRKLFVTKGCVACHSINGIGGHDAAALDAHTMQAMMNPFDFAAKMWRMAPVMIEAQEDELGEQIIFTGDELSDIVAFVHDPEEQKKFTEDDLTPEARHMMHEHHHGGSEEEEHHD